MNKRTLFKALAVGAVAALVLSLAMSCRPAPTPTPVPPTPTEAPPSPLTPTPLPPGPPRGGTVIFPIPEDPPSFNAFLTDTGYEELVAELVYLALAELDPDGNIYPELAEELPAVKNGGVVINDDGTMVVTWHLKKGVQWQDGTPVTSKDVKFTWKAITDPEGGTWAPGYDMITDIETPDDYTVIVHYDGLYANYLLQFGGEGTGIFPAHYCKDVHSLIKWECNRKPLSNGPFILEEWETGDHLTFARNPNYFEKDKPYLDSIIFKIVPDESVRKTMIEQGEADIDMWIVESFIDPINALPNVDVQLSPSGRWLMRLIPNLSEKGSADPEKPHPILSDVRVRRAIRMAIDVPLIAEEVFSGYAVPTWTEFYRPPFNGCGIPEPEYDPEGAKALLEEAGWVDQDGDGIRECLGCETAEEGYKMSMEFAIYASYGEELELAQQLIADMLKQVGIELELRIEEDAVIWGTWEDGGLEMRGNFDLNMWDDGYFGLDPRDFIWEYYASDAIPTNEDPEAGYNIMRWSNEAFDGLLGALEETLDMEERREIFCRMAQIMEEELPMIYLFTVTDAHAVSTRVKNVRGHINDIITWNAAEWYIEEK